MSDQSQTSLKTRRVRRKARVRSKISGTSARPRLAVFRSSQHIYAQIIDDTTGKTLASASSVSIDSKDKKQDVSAVVGKNIAKLCQDKGITEVVFDRGGYLYHGRVKALAEAAREGGLKF